MKSRRDFLLATATGAAALTAPRSLLGAPAQQAGRKGGKRLLILGGTGFIGPHIVEAARARGLTVTLFNRGKTNPHLFPDVEKLVGDRKSDLKALEGRSWDAVVDTSGYVPRLVRASAELLSKAVGQYVFISSVSVYRDTRLPADETSPVGKLKDESVEKVDDESYGPLKALCEQAAEKALPGRVTNIRPGFIVGPGDTSDRFTYWPVRVARGGEVLAPGTDKDPIQVIDGRDLGAWIVSMIERGHTGVYNAVGPQQPLSMGEVLRVCKEVSRSDGRFTWLDDAFLEKQKVTEEELPIWASPRGTFGGLHRTSGKRAFDKGLRLRPLPATIKDTLAYWQGLPEERRQKPRAGLKQEKEAAVLAAWHKRDRPG